MNIKNDFFEDLSLIYESWISTAARSLVDSSGDLKWTDDPAAFESVRNALKQGDVSMHSVKQVLSEVLRGQIISFLTMIDGGTQLAEKEKIELVDSKGNIICKDLHNEFISYLIETKRLE